MSATAAAEPKRILFVDDEPSLLDGLHDALRPFRRRWKMTFVPGGEEALSVLRQEPQDVVVSDLRMPSMDGATLLEQVRDLSPTVVRIVLSGHAELRVVARAAGVAHQLLAKPCETDHLVRVLESACATQEATARVALNRRAVGASVLPSLPQVYHALTDALSSGDARVSEIAGIVEQDMAIAAKVLALANSAYFGRSRPVTRISDAVIYLGLEALQALVLQAGAFHQFAVAPPIPGFDLDRLARHSCRVGHLARTLLGDATPSGDVFTAGLLHDVGLLVLATDEREVLTRILEAARGEGRPLYEVERELCGVTHAEIGAHLMALWGLPLSVTAAVSAHHDPPRPGVVFDEVTALYVANILIEEVEATLPGALPPTELDLEFLTACDLGDQLPRWRELAARQVDEV